jgi:hypothetical protein
MSKLFNTALLFCVVVTPVFAATTLFQGVFASDDQVALFSLTANTTETITIQTYSYGGGTVNSTSIPAGGFAPTGFLFDNLGDVQTLDSGNSSQVAQDSTTENYDDLYFQASIDPGTYTLALAVYDNTPVDTSVADGFVEDGNPGFTCQLAGTSGNFCDLTTALGTSRTGNYAIAISGADLVTQLGVPEPSSMLLLLAGGALLTLRRRLITR